MKATTLALMIAALFGLADAARADVIVYADSTTATPQNYGNSLGLDFNVNIPVVVSQLGVFDNGDISKLAGVDGTSGVSVAIYNLNGDVQVGPLVNFSVASPGTQINADAFKPVTPFVLPVGHYSVVAYNDNNGNSDPSYGIVQTQNSFLGHISFVAGGRNAGGFTFPTNLDPHSYSAGTFVIVTPEPSSCALAGLGAVGLLVIARRRKS